MLGANGAMAVFKRYLGPRVAAVAVVASLLVLGLDAPASTVPPVASFSPIPGPMITSFSPTSGPASCVIVITGTNFDDPGLSSIDIGGTPVSAFKIVNATEIWATVPEGASGTIRITSVVGSRTSPSVFTNANPGGCSPTIRAFSPCSGTAGRAVTIIGRNLLKHSGTTTTPAVGGDVRFAPYVATATHTGTPESPTKLSVLVPSDAADGQIRVSTFNDVLGEGAVLSDVRFEVQPPILECDFAPFIASFTPTSGGPGTSVVITGIGFGVGAVKAVRFGGAGATFTVDSDFQITASVPARARTGPIAVTSTLGTVTSTTDFTVISIDGSIPHSRSLTLTLRRHLVARGTLSATPWFTPCVAGVPVKIQRRVSGRWRTVASTTTRDTGGYKQRIRDRVGRYRAKAPRVGLGDAAACLADTSPIVRHTH